MSWNGKNASSAEVVETGFDIEHGGRVVPGVYWSPAGGAERLVLLGHGGTTHKKVDYIVRVAHGLCDRGIAAMAIDGPGHGDREIDATDAPGPLEDFAHRWHSGGGTKGVVEDWRVALDFVEAEHGARPTGWWGLSMGTMMGLPVCVADDRVSVGVLGLMGRWGPAGDDLMAAAPDLRIPIRFLVQWDDEVVPRDRCIELFTALGTAKKTMHANPGAHSAVPLFESVASVDYLDHYLR